MNPHDRASLTQDPLLERAFRERCRLLQEGILHNPIPEHDESRRRMYYAITRLARQIETELALSHLAAVNDHPGHDAMFFRHANIDAWLRFGRKYDESLRLKVKASMQNEKLYRMESGTENHKIMNAVAGYLTAQSWPDWEHAAEVKERCSWYLDNYLSRVCRFGQGEFDSPTYSVFYLNTLATMYDFAQDSSWKTRAAQMMDWYLANTAGEWLDGLYAGAHSRDYHPTHTFDAAPAGTVAAWLYFGGRRPNLRTGEPHYSIINALSAYRAPDIVVRIAQDRGTAFEHFETHDLTFMTEPAHDGHETRPLTGKNEGFKGLGYISRSGVRKYTYMTPGYALGSMADGRQGDIVWSGQLRRWSLDWRSEQPAGVLFFNHPFPDFGNPEEPYANKWQGSSPYEQVVQYKGALIALYHIPAGEWYKYGPRKPFPSDRDPYIDGFFSSTAILKLEEDASGWIFCHGGSVLAAVRVMRPYRWVAGEEVHRRMRSDGLSNAVLVQTAAPGDYSPTGEVGGDPQSRMETELALFREAVLAAVSYDVSLPEEGNPSATFQTLSGDELGIEYDGARTINGAPVRYDDWPLIGSPYLCSELNTGILDLRHGGQTLRLIYNSEAKHGNE
ncbi:hypothetical protein ABE504_09500 [Paenibacillus oryzisoli]|uniref:hypothetical protein n=1 Tax=Paenibacillus oryzisoli TaxID=1850517 RepID=UPI003D2BCFCE